MRDSNWHILETSFNPESLHHMETVFTIGNGYLGARGAFEEGFPGDRPATFVHGVFDDVPLAHTELVNVPNWLPFTLFVNGQRFGMNCGTIHSYRRNLDLRTGVLTRSLRWSSPSNHTVDITIERFASLADPHLLGIRYLVTPLNFDGQLIFRASLDSHVSNQRWIHWHTVDQKILEQREGYLQVRTQSSGIELCQAYHLAIHGRNSVAYAHPDCKGAPATTARLTAESGDTIIADKLIALVTSREVKAVRRAALSQLQAAVDRGYDDLRASNDAAWESTWETCNVTIEGDDEADLALRHSLFQLLISAPRHDDRVSIPAKTLSGFGYRGHVFWDTESFILPFFTFTQPRIARNLLMYRYHTLSGARDKARENGYEGAMFAWESAVTGNETTPRLVPGPKGDLVRVWTGDIQHHISADVAYGVMQYWRVTGDDAFMRDYGAEIVLETARFWGSRAEWNEEQNRYEMTDVMGPDEYHEHVDNNAFTNRMAHWNLEAGLKVLAWLRRVVPQRATELTTHLDLADEQLAHWADIVDRLDIPHDPETGLIEQFDGFFDLKDVDLTTYEHRHHSMQAELGIKETQRYQVIKQPDVLMLFYMLGDEYDLESLQANWDYYTPRTDLAYGSSLGPAIHALLSARLAKPESAYSHFIHAARTDLHNVRGNTGDGVHGATAGGLWQAVVFGFAGLRLQDDGYTIDPNLPSHWERLSFTTQIRGQKVRVDVGNGEGSVNKTQRRR